MINCKRQLREKLAGFERVVVWGTGECGSMAITSWLPREKIEYVVDANPGRLEGSTFFDKEVFPPEHILKTRPDCIVICSGAFMEILKELSSMGYSGESFFVYEAFFPPGRELSQLEMLYVDIAIIKGEGWVALLRERPQILVNVTLRVTKHLRQYKILYPLYLVARFFHGVISIYFGIQFSSDIDVGPGLHFGHIGSIVVHSRAKLGNFCTLFQNTTLGQNDNGEIPVLGDFVTVYAGAIVLGASEIGSYTRIGAQSLLLDFKCSGKCTIGGQPARILCSFGETGVGTEESQAAS